MKSALVMLISILLAGTAAAEMPGEKLFNRKCTMCHIVNGRGGAIGPDLSKIASKMPETQLRTKIAYPKKYSPGTSMPSFATLKPEEMQHLINYIKTLK